MSTVEERLSAIEGMMREIYDAICRSKAPGVPGMREYVRALEALEYGDKSLLEQYMANGGRIFKHQEVLDSGLIDPVADKRSRTVCRSPVQALRGRKANKELRPVVV